LSEEQKKNDSTSGPRPADISGHLFQPRLSISCAGCAKFNARASEVFVGHGNASMQGQLVIGCAADRSAAGAGAESMRSTAIYLAMVVSIVAGAWSPWIAILLTIAR
jgi:hypothetical protein